MNLFKLSFNNIRSRPLNTSLNVLILSSGVAIIVILLLLTSQLEQKLTKNASDIDLVVGAKGSPLQIILSNIYHVDYPTGNIPLEDAEKIVRNRFVEHAIPLALGDNYRSYRIVGTNHDYPELYDQQLKEGNLWQQEREVTIGANVAAKLKLKINDEFHGGHGVVQGGHDHEHAYKVVGIFAKNESIVDDLILTSIESVWQMHEVEKTSEHEGEKTKAVHSREQEGIAANLIKYNSTHSIPEKLKSFPIGEGKEITSLLIKYNSPMAIIQMPRIVNSIGALQAASPAIETARILSLFGVGIDLIESFAYLVILIAAFSIFIALYNSLNERKYDLAIMRSLGASRFTLLLHVILEGVLITFIGGILGFALGHGLLEVIIEVYGNNGESGITGFYFVQEELSIVGLCVLIGIVASLIPAIAVYRTDVSRVLAQG